MIDQLPRLQQLLRHLQQVPYLASKNLYRVSHYFLDMDEARLEQFITVLKAAHRETVKCPECWAWMERNTVCPWCDPTQRDRSTICVVETWHDLCAIEKTGSYRGVYHVLGGALCPLDGVGLDDLTIEPLIERVAAGCKELILAMNQTPEGDATAACIVRRVPADGTVSVTCLSRGVPVGSMLESMDRLTIFKALSERRQF